MEKEKRQEKVTRVKRVKGDKRAKGWKGLKGKDVALGNKGAERKGTTRVKGFRVPTLHKRVKMQDPANSGSEMHLEDANLNHEP